MARTGRPRGYEEDRVVESAKELFWTQGYDATSVQDLVTRLGLPRASLYSAFGDKHGLFLHALERYVEQARAGLLTLGQDGPVLPQVRQAFLDVVSPQSTAGGGARARGCLLGNTAVEQVPGSDAVEQLVTRGFAQMEDALTVVMQRAQANGEVDSKVDPAVVARTLLVLFEGLQILVRNTPAPDSLSQVVDHVLTSISAS